MLEYKKEYKGRFLSEEMSNVELRLPFNVENNPTNLPKQEWNLSPLVEGGHYSCERTAELLRAVYAQAEKGGGGAGFFEGFIDCLDKRAGMVFGTEAARIFPFKAKVGGFPQVIPLYSNPRKQDDEAFKECVWIPLQEREKDGGWGLVYRFHKVRGDSGWFTKPFNWMEKGEDKSTIFFRYWFRPGYKGEKWYANFSWRVTDKKPGERKLGRTEQGRISELEFSVDGQELRLITGGSFHMGVRVDQDKNEEGSCVPRTETAKFKYDTRGWAAKGDREKIVVAGKVARQFPIRKADLARLAGDQVYRDNFSVGDTVVAQHFPNFPGGYMRFDVAKTVGEIIKAIKEKEPEETSTLLDRIHFR